MAELYKQACSHIPDKITLPATWLHAYEEFISKNSSSVSQIESALRSLTYIIPGTSWNWCYDETVELTVGPGRYRESEIASESRPCYPFCILFPLLT